MNNFTNEMISRYFYFIYNTDIEANNKLSILILTKSQKE